ncbi:MAG TPA: ABC transporter permease subunit, partial [Thermoplasmata archaeon]|nr:ABC transporter permease subunit [Thermoplasmata archaeon]
MPVRSGGEPTPEEFLATAEASRRGFFAARLLRLPGLLVGGALLVFFFGLAGIAVLSFGSGLGHLPGSFSIGSMIPPPGPSWAHPFGYMAGNGVDILPALEQSTPWDIALVGTPILLALLIGLVLGGLAATGNVAVDAGLTFVTDVLVGVPPWILVIVFFLALQPVVLPADSLLLFGTISTLVLWPYYARPIRARAKAVAVEPYVEAARASGAQRGRL